MDARLHKELLRNTENLRALVGSCSTESVAGYCAAFFLPFSGSSDEPSPLSSKVRQCFFLLGLMLTTPEPDTPRSFGPDEWGRSVRVLEEIFSAYAWMFWPSPEEVESGADPQRDVKQVAMPAFLHYYSTALLASVEQVSDRIRRYLSPFDDPVKKLTGIAVSDALEIAMWVSNSLQKQADELVDASKRELEARLSILGRARVEGWSEERVWQEMQKDDYLPHMTDMVEGLQGFFKVSREAMREAFGADRADAFWRSFVSKRGEARDFTYLTERNPAEERPLFEVADGMALCPLANALYNAVLRNGEQSLAESDLRDAFLKKRDEVLEVETGDKLRPFFGASAEFWSGVYETPNLHFEHDLIIRWRRRLFVIEAKASPPTEPFRDPERAYVRIKRAFQSERGIQKAFEQAERIRRRLAASETVELYDARRNLIAKLEPQEIGQTYCVCVTRDDFGYLAVDLSLLLEKPEDAPYPWAVNIFDLEALLDAWSYFGWGPDRLCEYLEERQHLHGKVFTTDELAVAGFFIRHGSLRRAVEAETDMFVLNPEYTDVFDKIYLARRGAGEEVKYAPTEPFMKDMREMFNEAQEEASAAARSASARRVKQGRNERCACGSGLKYKRCCGR
jgi:hypothetical protein